MEKNNNRKTLFFILLNLLVIGGILVLPFYLFGGRLFLGGDDTRFYYIYPNEFLNSLALYSWNNISSLPYYIPNHYWTPLLLLYSVIQALAIPEVIVLYFSFSLVSILGFVYFQKFIYELIGNRLEIGFICGLIYVFSPITLVSLSFFLAPVWLISLIPLVFYYYLRYVKYGYAKDLVKVIVWSILFSFVYFSIPWILAVILPMAIGLAFFLPFIINSSFILRIKRTLVFGFFILSSQLFWMLPFLSSIYFGGASSLREKVESDELALSFVNTILSSATGNIVYPLLTYYQRKITFDYEWQLSNVFSSYYDLVFPFSVIYIFVLFFGFFLYKKNLDNDKKNIFLFFLVSFATALYLSTVNIGFLKEIFIFLGNIPGFAILRNFTDKFSIAFIFLYSVLLSFCYLTLRNYGKYYKLLVAMSILAIAVNVVPIKQIISAPLWKTENIYTSLNIPEEYILFTRQVKKELPTTSNVIVFPQNIAANAIITEANGVNAYVGTSPFKFLTGINDLTGSGSYPSEIGKIIEELVKNRRYSELLSYFEKLNIGYVMQVKNIPNEVLKSYQFDSKYLVFQDEDLLNAISGEVVVTSKNGNYVINKLKNSPSLFTSNSKIEYTKKSPIEYEVRMLNPSGKDTLYFHETYHTGWKLSNNEENVEIADHSNIRPYGNKWTINSRDKQQFSLRLYFAPQDYFYIGVLASASFLLVGFIVLFSNKK